MKLTCATGQLHNNALFWPCKLQTTHCWPDYRDPSTLLLSCSSTFTSLGACKFLTNVITGFTSGLSELGLTWTCWSMMTSPDHVSLYINLPYPCIISKLTWPYGGMKVSAAMGNLWNMKISFGPITSWKSPNFLCHEYSPLGHQRYSYTHAPLLIEHADYQDTPCKDM